MIQDLLEFEKSQTEYAEGNRNNDAFELSANPYSNKRRKTGDGMDMTKKILMEHIKTCQKIPGIGPIAAQIHSNEDKAIVLQSRQTTLQGFTDLIKIRRTNLSTSHICSDRTKYPIPVFSGMKGLGKTRMLEEWKLAFEGANICTDSFSFGRDCHVWQWHWSFQRGQVTAYCSFIWLAHATSVVCFGEF